ncbi:MAG: acetyltransferase [Pseudomonadota bacterium]|nr:acetyltransferase [Pseudomonadota bacterium]
MLLMEKNSGHLIEVLDPTEVFDPFKDSFTGRLDFGEDVAEPENFKKVGVSFPSGESLPKCWMDPHYRD